MEDRHVAKKKKLSMIDTGDEYATAKGSKAKKGMQGKIRSG